MTKGAITQRNQVSAFYADLGLLKPSSLIVAFVVGEGRGARSSSNAAHTALMSHMGTYAIVVAIINLKITANTYELIAEARMQ